MSKITTGNPIDVEKKIENIKWEEGNKNGEIDTREEVSILSIFLNNNRTELSQSQIDYINKELDKAEKAIEKEEVKATKRIEKRIKELSNANGYLAKDGAAELIELLKNDELTEKQANLIIEALKNSGFENMLGNIDELESMNIPAAGLPDSKFSVGLGVIQNSTPVTSISAGLKSKGTYINLTGGIGKNTMFENRVGHEFTNGNFGVDLSAGLKLKKLSQEFYKKGDDLYDISEGRINLGATGIYRPDPNLKIGLGVEAGYKQSTYQETVMKSGFKDHDVTIYNKPNSNFYLSPVFTFKAGGETVPAYLTFEYRPLEEEIRGGVGFTF